MGRTKKYHTPEERKAARVQYNQNYKAKQSALREIASCPTHNSNVATMILESESNKALRTLLGTHSACTSHAWPDKVTEYDIFETVLTSLFPNGIPPEIRQDRLFYTSICIPVSLRVLTLPHISLAPKQMKALQGGKIEGDYQFDPKTILSNPGDGTIGLVIVQSKSGENKDADFVFVCSSAVRNEDIVKMGEEENKSIKEMVKGSRAGPASGYSVLPRDTFCFDPISFALILLALILLATHNNRVLKTRGPNQQSTANSVSYSNKQNIRKLFVSAYRDMHMGRFSKATKKKEALESECYMRVLMLEMMSRLRIF